MWPWTRLLTRDLETDGAVAIALSPLARLAHQVLSMSLAQAVAWRPRARFVAPVQGGDLAQTVHWLITALLTPSTTAEVSQPVTRNPVAVLVLPAEDMTEVTLLGGGRVVLLLRSLDTSVSCPMPHTRTYLFAGVAEQDAIFDVTWLPTALLRPVSEWTTLRAIAIRAHIPFVGIEGTWSVVPLAGGSWVVLPRITGVWQVMTLVAGQWTCQPLTGGTVTLQPPMDGTWVITTIEGLREVA